VRQLAGVRACTPAHAALVILGSTVRSCRMPVITDKIIAPWGRRPVRRPEGRPTLVHASLTTLGTALFVLPSTTARMEGAIAPPRGPPALTLAREPTPVPATLDSAVTAPLVLRLITALLGTRTATLQTDRAPTPGLAPTLALARQVTRATALPALVSDNN